MNKVLGSRNTLFGLMTNGPPEMGRKGFLIQAAMLVISMIILTRSLERIFNPMYYTGS